jgi:hypothetical protein
MYLTAWPTAAAEKRNNLPVEYFHLLNLTISYRYPGLEKNCPALGDIS